MTDSDTPSAFEDPDNLHDDRATEDAAGAPGFPDSARSRHWLIADGNGNLRIAGHDIPGGGKADPNGDRCERLEHAFDAFLIRAVYPEHDTMPLAEPMPAGRYWCDVDDDGNFLVGSRVGGVA